MTEETVIRTGEYTIEKVAGGVYAIDSDRDESMYLVCGNEKAVMIDTGSCHTPVMPVIRTLWDGPVELLLTHAHYDHMEHSDEFETVYLHERDIAAWKKLRTVVHLGEISSASLPKKFRIKDFVPLHDGDVLDLGGKTLEIIEACGHTPGSVMAADKEDKLLFAGDAIGSGQYVWMWLPGCSTICEYKDSLQKLIRKIEPISGYTMLGGHRRQGKPFCDEENAHLLTIRMAEDLEKLCARILNGEEKICRYEKQFGLIKTRVYRYGQAEIVTSGKLVK